MTWEELLDESLTGSPVFIVFKIIVQTDHALFICGLKALPLGSVL
jgi:hypothetical protein